jgi:FdhD protein
VGEPAPVQTVPRVAFRDGGVSGGTRTIPEESPVALTYNRSTHAVMLATPADLEDFGIGFSVTEGIIGHPSELDELEIVPAPHGIEVRMSLAQSRLDALTLRQRRLAGPSGCGLCGMESLADAVRPPQVVRSTARFQEQSIHSAMAAMPPAQRLNQLTRTVHAAAFWTPSHGLIALREDVGRHNALDKLAGAMAREGVAGADGMLLVSSRVSVELIQKASVIGAPVLAAVSAPTALAVRMADQAGITLVGVARSDGFEVFTHPDRISARQTRNVA